MEKLKRAFSKGFDGFLGVLDFFVKLLSCEGLVTWTRRPNGGDVVLIRAVLISVWMFLVYIAVVQISDPLRTAEFSWKEMRAEISKSMSVFGAILGAVYLALYARFSSQWSYLADLYNQIKATEAEVAAQGASAAVIHQWKAGFIEDADDLHLSTKRIFAPVIHTWAKVPQVEQMFCQSAPGGAKRWAKLIRHVDAAVQRNAASYK